MFPQTFWSGPAFTNGPAGIVILTLEDTCGQAPFAMEVSLRVTDPAALSAAEGM